MSAGVSKEQLAIAVQALKNYIDDKFSLGEFDVGVSEDEELSEDTTYEEGYSEDDCAPVETVVTLERGETEYKLNVPTNGTATSISCRFPYESGSYSDETPFLCIDVNVFSTILMGGVGFTSTVGTASDYARDLMDVPQPVLLSRVSPFESVTIVDGKPVIYPVGTVKISAKIDTTGPENAVIVTCDFAIDPIMIEQTGVPDILDYIGDSEQIRIHFYIGFSNVANPSLEH